jgi:hypothetical protein
MTDLLLQQFEVPPSGGLVQALLDERRKMFGAEKLDAMTRIGIRLLSIRLTTVFTSALKGGFQRASLRRFRIGTGKHWG